MNVQHARCDIILLYMHASKYINLLLLCHQGTLDLLIDLNIRQNSSCIDKWMWFLVLILSFQLRNLVWATTKHDVYTVHNQSVTHWSSLDQTSTELINADDCIIPKQVPTPSIALALIVVDSSSRWSLTCKIIFFVDREGMVHSPLQWSRSQLWL